MNTKKKLIALLAIATLISTVNASVFVYYPINITITPQQPPVIFVGGNNANQTDLRGQKINVYISNYNTSLSIGVHPTLQRNYYYDIARIKNNDISNTYYIKFRVTNYIDDDRVTKAYLIISDPGTQYQKIVDLMDENLQPNEWISLGASGELRVDLYIVLSGYDGSSSISVGVDLIYSATSTTETPPELPST